MELSYNHNRIKTIDLYDSLKDQFLDKDSSFSIISKQSVNNFILTTNELDKTLAFRKLGELISENMILETENSYTFRIHGSTSTHKTKTKGEI